MPLERRLRDGLERAAAAIEPNVETNLERVTRRAGSRSTVTSTLAAATVALLIVVIVVVALPRGRPDATVPGGSQGDASPVPSAGIVGRWTVTLEDTDAGVSDLGMAGAWTLRLGGDSTIDLQPPTTFTAPSGASPIGYLHTEDGATFLTTLFARDFGATCAGPGMYSWSVSESRLSFRVTTDTCAARRTLLTTRTWSRG